MMIIESWEDHISNIYAIVEHSKDDKQKYKVKAYEAMYLLDGELHSFGGSVGHGVADFDTVLEAQEFLLRGIALQSQNPDVWLGTLEA